MPRLLNRPEQHSRPAIPSTSAGPPGEAALTLADSRAPIARRLQAIQELRASGEAGVEPLCLALADPNGVLRLQAIEALGEVGDERAVAPLIEALRGLFPGRSARRFRLAARLLLVTGVLAVLGAVAVALASGDGLGVLLLALLGGSWSLLGRSSGPSLPRLCAEIARALNRIAERHPTPALRSALPSLREIEADTLQQDAAARSAAGTAVRRIDELTAQLEALPIPAGAQSEDARALPLASSGPACP